jgi:hypothetical protein
MYEVEAIQRVRHSVRLMELERVVRLWSDVHPDYLEACSVIAHSGTAGTRKKIEHPHAAALAARLRSRAASVRRDSDLRTLIRVVRISHSVPQVRQTNTPAFSEKTASPFAATGFISPLSSLQRSPSAHVM